MGEQEEEKGLVAAIDGADGWIEPVAAPSPLRQALAGEIEEGKTLAILSHASLLFGIPLFIVPILTRDNRFALHHAKAAGVTFSLFIVSASLTAISCGIFFPMMLLCYVPALIGIVQAANGQLAGPWGMGDMAERLLGGLKVPPAKLPPAVRHLLDTETHDE